MQLNNEQLVFLARFARSPDGVQLLKILRAKQAYRDKAARTARGEDVHRHLGAADQLDELIASLENAQQTLDRNATSHTMRRVAA